MASNSKYNIDVFNIRPLGEKTKGLYVGGDESFYSWLGDKCIYDKVLYELSMNDVPASETTTGPEGFTLTASDYAPVNKRTHGNGDVDENLALNPSTVTFTPNTSTANTVTTQFTVAQYDDALGDYVGASVTWSVTQAKDYPVSATLSLGSPSVIGAGGGSVSTTTWSATVTFKSGNVVSNTTSLGTTSFNTVSAGSKGTTNSDVTTAGTLVGSYSYTCNGHTVTASTSVTVYQAANAVVSTVYGDPYIITDIQYATVGYGGGTVRPTQQMVMGQSRTRTWTSGGQITDTVNGPTSWQIHPNTALMSVVGGQSVAGLGYLAYVAGDSNCPFNVSANTSNSSRTLSYCLDLTNMNGKSMYQITRSIMQEAAPKTPRIISIEYTVSSANGGSSSGGSERVNVSFDVTCYGPNRTYDLHCEATGNGTKNTYDQWSYQGSGTVRNDEDLDVEVDPSNPVISVRAWAQDGATGSTTTTFRPTIGTGNRCTLSFSAS